MNEAKELTCADWDCACFFLRELARELCFEGLAVGGKLAQVSELVPAQRDAIVPKEERICIAGTPAVDVRATLCQRDRVYGRDR
jgi:hypothetical protein